MSLPNLLAQPWLRPALLALLGLLAFAALAGLFMRRRRRLAPPEWPRVIADTEYYRRVLSTLFPARGFQVSGYRLYENPEEEAPREIVFALRKEGRQYAALCVRWIVPVTSEVVGRFERALQASKADQGLIVTTSLFTEAARERAQGLPVALIDRDELAEWIAAVWGERSERRG